MSYTSQDAQPARSSADALRAVGIAEWLEQSELRGARVLEIREQIRTCAIFVLAADRSQDTCA